MKTKVTYDSKNESQSSANAECTHQAAVIPSLDEMIADATGRVPATGSGSSGGPGVKSKVLSKVCH